MKGIKTFGRAVLIVLAHVAILAIMVALSLKDYTF